MLRINEIFGLWKTAEELAGAIDVSGVTVRAWRNRGYIPPLYWEKIIRAARTQGREFHLSIFAEMAIEAVHRRRPPPDTAHLSRAA